MGGSDQPRPVPAPTFHPSPQQTGALIDRAKRHPLGTEFLLHGSLDAVAATFQVHAFVVNSARTELRDGTNPASSRGSARLAVGTTA